MKFIERNDRIGREGTRAGFTQKDSFILMRETHIPKTQIFSAEELEPEPEERIYFYAMCKSKLDYLTGTETVWKCNECMEYYDLCIQDSSIKDTTDFKLVPYADLQYYPTFDENDPKCYSWKG